MKAPLRKVNLQNEFDHNVLAQCPSRVIKEPKDVSIEIIEHVPKNTEESESTPLKTSPYPQSRPFHPILPSLDYLLIGNAYHEIHSESEQDSNSKSVTCLEGQGDSQESEGGDVHVKIGFSIPRLDTSTKKDKLSFLEDHVSPESPNCAINPLVKDDEKDRVTYQTFLSPSETTNVVSAPSAAKEPILRIYPEIKQRALNDKKLSLDAKKTNFSAKRARPENSVPSKSPKKIKKVQIDKLEESPSPKSSSSEEDIDDCYNSKKKTYRNSVITPK